MEHLARSKQEALTGSLAIQIVTTRDGLRSLKGEWDRLHKLGAAATIFWDHAYVSAWWAAFHENATQYTLVVRRDGEAVAIFPFMRAIWTVRGMPMRQLSFIRNEHVLRSDALIAIDASTCTKAVLQHLKDNRWAWDVLYLENTPESSEIYPRIAEVAQQLGFPTDPWRRARTHRILPVTGTWDGYLSGRSSNFRWQMKKFRKRLDALGTIEIERIHTRTELLAFLPELFQLEKKSWQGQGSDSAMDTASQEFCRLLVSDMPDDKLGEFWAMRANGRLIAAITLLRLERVLSVFTTYFDPEMAAASPGTLLYLEMLKSAWSRGERIIDFNGDSVAFQRWTSQTVNHFRLRIYSCSWYGRALHYARSLGVRAPGAVLDDAS